MAGIEDKVNSLFQTVQGLNQNNLRLEGELVQCKREVLALKKFKIESEKELVQTKKELEQSMKKIQSLEASVESLVSAAPGSKSLAFAAPGSNAEMESSIGESTPVPVLVAWVIFSKIQSLEATVESLVSSSGGSIVKMEPSSEVDNIRYEGTGHNSSMQNQQRQQATPKPTQQPPASMAPKKRAFASTPLTQPPASMAPKKQASASAQHLTDLQTRSKFDLCEPSMQRLQTGISTRVVDYRRGNPDSPFMDRKSGVFNTPTRGRYKFGAVMRQKGSGRWEFYLCEDREGRRQLLGKTERHGDLSGCYDVLWECDEGVGVWLEMKRVEGEAEVVNCGFTGELV